MPKLSFELGKFRREARSQEPTRQREVHHDRDDPLLAELRKCLQENLPISSHSKGNPREELLVEEIHRLRGLLKDADEAVKKVSDVLKAGLTTRSNSVALTAVQHRGLIIGTEVTDQGLDDDDYEDSNSDPRGDDSSDDTDEVQVSDRDAGSHRPSDLEEQAMESLLNEHMQGFLTVAGDAGAKGDTKGGLPAVREDSVEDGLGEISRAEIADIADTSEDLLAQVNFMCEYLGTPRPTPREEDDSPKENPNKASVIYAQLIKKKAAGETPQVGSASATGAVPECRIGYPQAPPPDMTCSGASSKSPSVPRLNLGKLSKSATTSVSPPQLQRPQ